METTSDPATQTENCTRCSPENDSAGGPFNPPETYCVNTEGTEHPWQQATISREQIAQLGGWNADQGVIEVLADNSERTLAPGEVIPLEPGRAFCRRVRWKRGLGRADRIAAEIELLRRVFPKLEFRDRWVRIPGWRLPSDWNRSESDVAFEISDAYPGAPPYGLYCPTGLRFNGRVPANYAEPAGNQPPFGGVWGLFSWSVVDANDWRPSASVENGVNLLQWVRGFSQRFAEGV